MKIAYYHPPQVLASKDIAFCKHSKHSFLRQTCDNTVDIIYAASVSVLQAAVNAKARFNKPLICWCWDIPYNWRDWGMSEDGMKRNAGRDNRNKNLVALLKQCDMVISGSKWTQSVLLEQFGVSSEQLYFYIDFDSIDAVPFQVKEDMIVQVSRFFFNKKFENTIMASKDLIDYEVVLMGTGSSGSYGRYLKQVAKEHNNRVSFKDALPRNQVVANMKKATVLVSPSMFEGWGMTPIEALYCGTPVLLSDLDVSREMYGDSVLYHKPNDVDDMTEKLERLVNDEDLQNKIVADCKPIISQFTMQKFIKRWENLLDK